MDEESILAMNVRMLLFLVFIAPNPCIGETLYGRIVGISDGDTATLLLAGNKQLRLRMAEVDCPESSQPYGNQAKRELSGLIYNKAVSVTVMATDRYGRTVGRVYVDGLYVNSELVKSGACWVFRKYAKDQSLFPLEAQAKQEQRGLWRLPEKDRIPPWEWRHPAPKNTSAVLPLQDKSGFACSGKKTCRQMASCEEARFYLHTCGVASLDGNHDGIPCSRLCR